MKKLMPLSFWTRLVIGVVILSIWALTLVDVTWLAFRGLVSSSWDWSYLIIIPLFALGLFTVWVSFLIVLERCKAWLRHSGFHLPGFRH